MNASWTDGTQPDPSAEVDWFRIDPVAGTETRLSLPAVAQMEGTP